MRNSIQVRKHEDVAAMLAHSEAAGFREVSVSLGVYGEKVALGKEFEAEVEQIGLLLEQYHLKCTQTHLPCYSLLESSEEVDEAMEQAIKTAIQASATLGAPWTAMHPRSAVNAGFNRTKSFAHNRAFLESYLEVGERYGVGIAVENMPLYPSSSAQWRFFGGGWEELCELCDSFRSDKVGICWDFGHAHTAALDQPAAIRDMGSRLKITHVHDNYRNGDHHQLPGLGSTEWGCIEWKPIMQALREVGYAGPLTLEIIFPPEPMRKSFIQCGFDSLNYLKSLK